MGGQGSIPLALAVFISLYSLFLFSFFSFFIVVIFVPGDIPQAQERSRSTTSVASLRSSDVDMTMDISSDHVDVSQAQAVIGGIPSDDDEVEQQEVATRVMNTSSASGVRFRVRANLNSSFS